MPASEVIVPIPVPLKGSNPYVRIFRENSDGTAIKFVLSPKHYENIKDLPNIFEIIAVTMHIDTSASVGNRNLTFNTHEYDLQGLYHLGYHTDSVDIAASKEWWLLIGRVSSLNGGAVCGDLASAADINRPLLVQGNDKINLYVNNPLAGDVFKFGLVLKYLNWELGINQ